MRRLLLVIVLLLVVTSLFGCKEKEKPSGEIHSMEVKEAYTQVILLPTSIYNGKTVTIIFIPYIRSYPERYIITVKWLDEEKDMWLYYDYYVSYDIYQELNVGDYFEYKKDGVYDEEPYTQVKQ